MRIPPMSWAASLGLVILVTTVSHAKETAIEIPLQPYFRDLRTVSVEVGGESMPFLLDTGGGMTFLTPATAKKIGVKPFGAATGFRYNGDKLTGPRGGVVPIRIGGIEMRCEVGIFDLDTLGINGVGGIVALQTFEGRAITLDLGGNRLILETQASLKKRVAGMHELTVRPQREAGGATLDLFARATAPVGDLWLEMDCGNLQPLLLAPHTYQQLGVEPAGKTAGPVPMELAGYGPLKLDAMQVDTIYDGLLNSAFFMQNVVTFDLKAMRVWAVPRTGDAHR